MDRKLTDAIDRVMARLQEERGLTLPVLLREATAATFVIFVVCAVVAFTAGSEGASAFASLAAVAAGCAAYRWRQFNRDAVRPWSQAMARFYADRAASARVRLRPVRLAGMGLGLGQAAWLAWSAVSGRVEPELAVSLMATAVVLGQAYADCAMPRPPGTRRTARVPASAARA
jgi:hypothetical protein